MYISFALTAFVLGMLPVCLARPWIGMLMWWWLAYMNPHRLTWSYTHSMPFAFMVAVPTLVGLLLAKDRQPLPRVRETYLLMSLWAFFLLTTGFAMNQAFAWDFFYKVSKIFLFTLLPLLLFQDRQRLRCMLLVVALSIGFYGLKGGIWAIATGGANRVMMPDDTMLGGANGAGLALNMVIPLLLYLSREERNPWLRWLLRVTFVFSIPASLFTYSRGAILGLLAVVLVLAAKSRRVISAMVGLTCLCLFLVSFAPPQWFERMDTIQKYEDDTSASSRLDAWYIAYRLAVDHPILGGGFGSVGLGEVVDRYVPGSPGFNSHSIFFNMMGEHGFVGLALFLAIILSCFVSLRSLRARRDPRAPEWIRSYSHAIEAGLIGYVVTGMFLSAAYLDLFYQFVGVVILLEVLADREAHTTELSERALTPASSVRGRRLTHVRDRGDR